MVAKAATKAGKFFCFRCGEQVDKEVDSCQSCGARFDRVTEAFRCPKCSNLLPIGTAVCPSCSLKFKVRSVTKSVNMSEDDRFLMKLIDWGKAKREASVGKAGPDSSAARQQQAEPARQIKKRAEQKESSASEASEPAATSEAARSEGVGMQDIIGRLEETERKLREASVRRERSLELLKGYLDGESGGIDGVSGEMEDLLRELTGEIKEMGKLEGQIKQLRSLLLRGEASRPAQAPGDSEKADTSQETFGLSKQALRNLLRNREKEVDGLKTHQEEIERREEMLNRKIRAYAVKKKELNHREKELKERQRAFSQIEFRGAGAPTRRGGEQSEDDAKTQWLRDQSKIRMGLLEIKNEMSPGEQSIDFFPSHMSDDVMEKIEVLEERLADSTREREELADKLKDIESAQEDIIRLLKVMDQLLGKLPPAVIDEFSKSEDFRLYEKVLDKLNI